MMTTSRFVLNKIGKYRQEHNLDFETIDKLMDVNVMEIVDEYDLDNNIVNHDLYTSWSEEAYDLIPRLIENGYTNRAIAMVFSTTYKATESFVSSSIDCKFSDFWNTNGRVGKSQEATPINLDLYFKNRIPQDKHNDDAVWLTTGEITELFDVTDSTITNWCRGNYNSPPWFLGAKKLHNGFWKIKVSSDADFAEKGKRPEKVGEDLSVKISELEKQVEKNTSMLAKLYDTPIVRWFCKD